MFNVPVIFILHAYQPPYPIQERFVNQRIIKNTYIPISQTLLENPDVKFVINMNASLTEVLINEAPEVVDNFNEASKQGQIEFLESGAYHPIFPLIPEEWVIEQIRINNQINSQAFGDVYQPTGIWPPELAIDMSTLRIASELNYDYVIVPNNSLPGDLKSFPFISFSNKPLYLFARNNLISNKIAFNSYNTSVSETVDDIQVAYEDTSLPVILAMDMETFGEHNEDYWSYLFELLNDMSVIPTLLQELDLSWSKEIEMVKESSWSTSNDDISKNIPYPLWDHPTNPIHALQQTHMQMIFEELAENGSDVSDDILKSMHSCQFWWADNQAGRWSADMIRKGFEMQQNVIQKYGKHDLTKRLSSGIRKRLYQILEQF